MAAETRTERAQRQLRENLLRNYRDFLQREDTEEEEEVLDVHILLEDALSGRASDIHLDPVEDAYRVRLRIDGLVLDAVEVSVAEGERLVNQFKALANLDPIPAVSPHEGSFSYRLDRSELDLRVTVAPCIAGEKVAVRLLAPPEGILEVEELGIPGAGVEGIRHWMDATGGMMLVSGPTGSGKTTTLYALLHKLKLSDSQVITLEDPVEYEIPGINQIQVDPAHDLTFVTGIPSLLRLDPDYVLIGELRDSPSAEAAVSVAASGRSLMGTLHSRDAVATVTALRNFGIDNHEIAANIGLISAQRLVRKLCPHCREKRAPNDREKHWLGRADRQAPEFTWDAKGCSECDHLGFAGRTGVFEIWQPDEQDRERILKGEEEHGLRRALAQREHRLIIDDGMDKVADGITNLEELLHAGCLQNG